MSRSVRVTANTAEREPFTDDVLERLFASNQDYQRSHGHFIVPLAERLLHARAERDTLTLSLDTYRSALSGTQHVRDGYKSRALVAEAALLAIHANATSWHGDDEAKGRALNVIAAWALHPESIPAAFRSSAVRVAPKKMR